MNNIRFPPAGYVPTESDVPGIQLYMPAPQDAIHQEVVQFNCTQCAGETAYSAEGGGLTCTYCGYHEPAAREVVGKGAEEFEFTVTTVDRAAHGWGVERKLLVCERCAAQTAVPPDALTHTCPFCGANQVIQQQAPQDLLRPRFLVPVTITREQCRERVRAWLGSSWMTPDTLQQVARVADFTPLYLPYWTFDARTAADWRAQVAHTKTEWYTDSEGRRRSRTKTEWKWESGHVDRFFDDLLVPGTGKVSTILLQRIEDYHLADLVVYEPSFLAGTQAQAYDVTLNPAWESARSLMREATRAACRDQASNSRMRNFSMTLDFSEESWRYLLLPVYVAAYRYEDQRYQVLVNGQSGTVAGQRPVAWLKVWLAVAGLLAPGLLVGVVALLLLATGAESGVFVGVVAFILLVVGVVIGIRLLQQAQGMDDV